MPIDVQDEVAFLNADLGGGRIVADGGDDDSVMGAPTDISSMTAGEMLSTSAPWNGERPLMVSASRGGISGAGMSFNESSTVFPLRRMLSFAAPPIGLTPSRKPRLSASSTVWPSTATMTSPRVTPAAAAGLSLSTSETSAPVGRASPSVSAMSLETFWSVRP